ncbi:MAG TPA: hypothetical protein VGD98_22070 [Ktedonobacteraceae bacterium]
MSQPFPQSSASPTLGKVALFIGLRAGLLLGIAQSIIIIYQNHGPDSVYVLLTGPLSLLLWVSAFLGSGYLTARRSGKVSAGTLAGLWAGLIGGVFTAGTILFETISYYWGYYDFETIIAVLAASLTGLILLILLTMGAGTGLGSLGGLIGQSFFKRTPLPPLTQYQQQNEPPQQQTQTK